MASNYTLYPVAGMEVSTATSKLREGSNWSVLVCSVECWSMRASVNWEEFLCDGGVRCEPLEYLRITVGKIHKKY